MPINQAGFGGGLVGKTNATAGTVHYAIIPGNANGFARITGFQYACGATANDFTLMRPIGRANTANISLNNAATLTLDGDPFPTGNTIAAGDQVSYLGTDGVYYRGQVSAWNGTSKLLTLTANLSANVASGSRLWNFGVPADTDPVTNSAHVVFTPVANSTATVDLGGVGFRGAQKGDPLLVYNPNATNATNTNFVAFAHTVE